MKIYIIGAGIGGLQAAKTLAQAGMSVTVFERNKREQIAYDWLDDVETKVFEELDLPLPDGYFRTANVTFAPPLSDKLLAVNVADEKRDWSVERRPLSEILLQRAITAGAELAFEKQVDSLIIEEDTVKGIVVNGEKLYCDMVIDSGGVFSKTRSSLPPHFNIQANPTKEEVFQAYRAFFKPKEGVEVPTENTKLIYLKHLGEMGISWRVIEPNNDVNVLVGRIGELTEEALQRALADLRERHPIISEELLRGGGLHYIPVRYPISRMVASGYALVGDSAFMTIPLIGSGIANALRAGQILAETILKHGKTDIASLWEYQYLYYTEIGAQHFSVDLLKRMLLSKDAESIRFLFESGVISEAEFDGIGAGEKLKMGFADIIDKIKRGGKRLGLLIAIAKQISKGEKAEKYAGKIPSAFDEKKVTAWQKKIDAFFAN